MKRTYRINYVSIAANVALLVYYSLPPYTWTHLLGVLNFCAIILMVIAIRTAKQSIRRSEQRQVRAELEALQLLWTGELEHLPVNWQLADTRPTIPTE